MSDIGDFDEKPTEGLPIEDEPEIDETEPEITKKGKKGLRKSTVMTPDKLEVLRLARIKALEVRRANSIKNGKAAIREEKKQQAAENTKKYEDNYNKKVDDEVNRRMMSMSMDDKMSKIDELVEAKLKAALANKKKPKKKVVEEESSDSEEEVIVRKRRPKKIVYEEVPMPTPREPEPEPIRAPPQRNLGSMFQYDPVQMQMNMLNTVRNRRSMVPRM